MLTFQNKIYLHAQIPTSVKKLLTSQVDKIIWQYKLSPETLHLPASDSVQEIQVFDVMLKTEEYDQKILQCIDKAIPSLIFFRVHFHETVQLVAAYKTAELDTIKLSSYFCSEKNIAFANAASKLYPWLSIYKIYMSRCFDVCCCVSKTR
jgi:hypothetical protein